MVIFAIFIMFLIFTFYLYIISLDIDYTEKDGLKMIEVTKLNDKKIILNCELIEHAEANPDTMIKLTTGNNIVVKESIEELKEKVIEYKKKIFVENWQNL